MEVHDNPVRGDIVQTKNVFLSNTTKKDDTLHIWVISEIKSNITTLEDSFKNNYYDESDSSHWRPFSGGSNILELIKEYKSVVNFPVKERFLLEKSIEKSEKSSFIKNSKNIVLVVDPFAINPTHKYVVDTFNNDNIGGCLVLLCQSIPHNKYIEIKATIENHFERLNCCYLDYLSSYIHFIFPISTKEQFFRSLSNIAFEHLNFSSKVEDADATPRGYKFTL